MTNALYHLVTMATVRLNSDAEIIIIASELCTEYVDKPRFLSLSLSLSKSLLLRHLAFGVYKIKQLA